MVLPLRDKNPSGIVPWVVYGLISVNAVAFLGELALPRENLQQLALRYGLVPSNVTLALMGQADILWALLVPAFTSMFLHGGWAHLIGNMWFLFIFGDNVEGRLGHIGFLLFYLLCGLMAGTTQYLLSPHSPIPTIRASGAIAGVLGAYAVCWPRARVLTLVPVFYLITFVELPAVMVLGFWFLIQLLQGAASLGVPFAHGGVAYGAHVAGFIVGLGAIRLLPRSKKSRRDEEAGRRPPPRNRRPH